MKTLVYFASGPSRDEYQNLAFDQIILIDNCFKSRNRSRPSKSHIGKVTCLGMDCLESIAYLRENGIKIDCFVSLNEGLYEGGGSYAINSDFFIGYAMPLLSDNYIHIMNKRYYHNYYKVSMDLPYQMREIKRGEECYLDPFIFSKYQSQVHDAKVYQMSKIINKYYVAINPKIKVVILQDSIWNYYDSLDKVVISFTQQGQGEFFDRIPNTININETTIDEILELCSKNKISRIGFTPWAKGKYGSFIARLKGYKEDFPKEILLFHLNKSDYKELKECVME